jgi:hypothetical protein
VLREAHCSGYRKQSADSTATTSTTNGVTRAMPHDAPAALRGVERRQKMRAALDGRPGQRTARQWTWVTRVNFGFCFWLHTVVWIPNSYRARPAVVASSMHRVTVVRALSPTYITYGFAIS